MLEVIGDFVSCYSGHNTYVPSIPNVKLCIIYPVAQALEKQQAQEEQQTQSITEIMKNPSKVILLKVTAVITDDVPLTMTELQNMVGPGEVDDDLQPEVTKECSKYGEVVKCLVYEVRMLFDWSF